MESRKIVLFLGIFILGMMFIGFVNAEGLVSESGVIYSERILEQFDNIQGTNENFVDVMIYPKDVSYKEEIISDLSDKNVGRIVNRNISNKITVKVTEDVFFELLEDERIEKISYNAPIKLVSSPWQKRSFKISLTFGIIFFILLIILVFILIKLRRNKNEIK